MKKKYIEPTAETLTLDLIALMAGSIKDVNSEDIDPEVSGSNEPAHSFFRLRLTYNFHMIRCASINGQLMKLRACSPEHLRSARIRVKTHFRLRFRYSAIH